MILSEEAIHHSLLGCSFSFLKKKPLRSSAWGFPPFINGGNTPPLWQRIKKHSGECSKTLLNIDCLPLNYNGKMLVESNSMGGKTGVTSGSLNTGCLQYGEKSRWHPK